ncbi:MAG: histidine kinase [Caldilineaceae bacterium]|nr:histidine kinase [Caldilineaceae bacterium]
MWLGGATVVASFLYLGVLFAIAYYGDKRADRGRSIINNPYVYALSMSVYCTAWTYYGSVGRAAGTGIGFLPIYIGPTLVAVLWWFVLRKMVRISQTHRITTIADFMASRYGKSTMLGGMVTCIAVIGIVPYISLQLEAVSVSFTLLWRYPEMTPKSQLATAGEIDTALWVTLGMAAFAILFGTRHLDVTEHHEGLVAAIAFESIVKLLAFLAAGIFVSFFLFSGPTAIFEQAILQPDLGQLLTFNAGTFDYSQWAWLTFLSMLAILFLPRQFQMAVLENMDENHIRKASWLFPFYLLVINIFVLPIALAGLLIFQGGAVDADMFVLALPMVARQEALTLFIFIGGLSAATGMVIVDTVALSTMVSNDLVMPILLRLRLVRPADRGDYGGLLLGVRRVAIVLIMVLGYFYFRATDTAVSLVSIGLISFAAVAQFAPAFLGGIYWKGGTRAGALAGLAVGFLVWAYTLPLAALHSFGGVPDSFLSNGPAGIEWLRPYSLFGLAGMDPVAHSLFWSLLANLLAYAGVSLLTQPSALEQGQASRFVDIFNYSSQGDALFLWRGTATVPALRSLLERFLGVPRTHRLLVDYGRSRGLDLGATQDADAEMVQYAERLLAGVMGAASARVAIASVVQEESLAIDEVLRLLDETSQIRAYSRQLEQRTRQLEQKSLELEAATKELRAANERLQELDRLKDDFISTVTHELRTPLTSIRAFSEILYDNPELDGERRTYFLEIILKESERLTRLINQVLDLAKLESGAAEWNTTEVDVRALINEALTAASGMAEEKAIRLTAYIPERLPTVWADRDRIMQVMMNLLSNAVKFCEPGTGQVKVLVQDRENELQIDVVDNGPGIELKDQVVIFDKFRQGGDETRGKPQGTGLGLPISAQIIAHFGGRLWVDSEPGSGATFSFTLPISPVDGAGYGAARE